MKSYSKLLRVVVLLAVGLMVLLPARPVYADTPDPDSTPSIQSFNVYHNLLETDDFLVLIYANIPYDTPPDDPVTETFIWRMIDTDDVTELGSTVGYAYQDNGYGYNVYSMYWTADEVDDLGIVWDTEYTIRLSSNPTAFDDPQIYDFTIDVSDYTDMDETADVKAEMGVRILHIAGDLNIRWALLSDYFLTLEIETGTALSIYGEAFFRGVVFGLQGMVPQIFRFVVSDMEVTARDWDPAYSENLTSQWAGTWVGDAKDAGATLFGTDYDLPSLMLVSVGAIAMVFCGLVVAHDTWGGIIDASVILLLGAKLDFFGLGYLGLIISLCMLYISARMWGMARG